MNKINNLLDRLDGEYNKKQLSRDSKVLTPMLSSTNQHTFVGRQKDVQVIDKFFSISNALVLVSSVEGVGKSSLASHYLNQNKSSFDYSGYVKINDSFRQSFTASFKESLNLQLDQLDDLFIEAVTKLSNLEGRKLLIIDNSKGVKLQEEKLNLVLSLIDNNFKILFISDTKIKDVREYRVSPLNNQDATNLFINYCPTSKLNQVERIIEYCANHTFFIKLIAKMIRSRRTNFDEIIEKFQTKELLALSDGDIKAIIHSNIQELIRMQNLDFESRLLLKRLSVLPSVEMEREFLQILFKEDIQSKLDLLANIGLLSRLGSSYKMHHIIKHHIHDYMPPTRQELAPILEFFMQLVAKCHDPDTIVEAKRYLIYFKSLKTTLFKLHDTSAAMGEFFANLGTIYYHFGENTKALELLHKALEIQKKSSTSARLTLAEVYRSLGVVYQSTKEYARALMFFKKALQLRLQELDEEHLDVSASYNDIGLLYRLSGNYEEALLFFEKALRIKEQNLDKYEGDLASIYNAIALTYQSLNHPKKSLLYFDKAIKIREKNLGKEHPHTARLYSNVAILYKDMKKYSKALSLLERAIDIDTKVGNSHQNNIAHYNKLVRIYLEVRKPALALEYLERIVDIKLSTLGPYHPRTAIGYNNLGVFYLAQNNPAQALSFFRKALGILNNITKKESLYLALLHHNLATAHYLLREYRDSVELFEKVLGMRQKVLGEHNPDTITSYNALAATYYELLMDDKALTLYEKTLELSKDISGELNLNTALSYHNIAIIYFNKAQYIKANRYMQQAVEIRQKFLLKQDSTLLKSKEKLKIIKESIDKVQKNPKHKELVTFRLDFFTHSKNIEETLVIEY